MSASLAYTIDQLRFLGRQAYLHDLRAGDLVLVKHQEPSGSGFTGLFGHVRVEMVQQPKRRLRKQPPPRRVVYVGEVEVNTMDQFTYFGDEHTKLSVLDELLSTLALGQKLALLLERRARRIFTGEVVLFNDAKHDHIRIEKFGAADERDVDAATYLKVVRWVKEPTAEDRALYLRSN